MRNDLAKSFEEYYGRIRDALRDERIRVALDRAVPSFRRNMDKILSRYPHTVKLAEEVRRIKEDSLRRWEELVEEAMDSIRENKGEAYFARDGEEVARIVEGVVGRGKLVVKSKSLTCDEIDLRERLEGAGNEVWETDLGELIVQLMGIKPMHILSPAIHVPREEVARLFSKVMNREIQPEIAKLTKAARRFLRDKYVRADVGISGANVVAADTGSLIILENEGNARLVTGFPRIHIAVVGLEKVVPTILDAFKVAQVTWSYANFPVSTYVNIISGLSKTGDIENVATYGVHGPEEIHVIFLDNGRSKLANDDLLREALYCLRCGGCLFECPVFELVAGNFGHKYFGGIGVPWTAYVVGGFARASPMAFTCLMCGRCTERCPMKIRIPEIVRTIRSRALFGPFD